MPVIYAVTVEPAEKENRFRITWYNEEMNIQYSFTQEAEITPEETQRLWQWPQCQMGIGRKLFRFLDGEGK